MLRVLPSLCCDSVRSMASWQCQRRRIRVCPVTLLVMPVLCIGYACGVHAAASQDHRSVIGSHLSTVSSSSHDPPAQRMGFESFHLADFVDFLTETKVFVLFKA